MVVEVTEKKDLPDLEVFRTVLEYYFNNEKTGADGWCIFSTFEDFINCRYKQAIDQKRIKKINEI